MLGLTPTHFIEKVMWKHVTQAQFMSLTSTEGCCKLFPCSTTSTLVVTHDVASRRPFCSHSRSTPLQTRAVNESRVHKAVPQHYVFSLNLTYSNIILWHKMKREFADKGQFIGLNIFRLIFIHFSSLSVNLFPYAWCKLAGDVILRLLATSSTAGSYFS